MTTESGIVSSISHLPLYLMLEDKNVNKRNFYTTPKFYCQLFFFFILEHKNLWLMLKTKNSNQM